MKSVLCNVLTRTMDSFKTFPFELYTNADGDLEHNEGAYLIVDGGYPKWR